MEKFKEDLYAKMNGNPNGVTNLTLDEAIGFMQPRYFTRGRNMYSQVKDANINIDLLTSSLIKK